MDRFREFIRNILRQYFRGPILGQFQNAAEPELPLEYILNVNLDELGSALDEGRPENAVAVGESAEEEVPQRNETDTPPGRKLENAAETFGLDQPVANASQAQAPDEAQPITAPCEDGPLLEKTEKRKEAGTENDATQGINAASALGNNVGLPQKPDDSTLVEVVNAPDVTNNDVENAFALPSAEEEMGACAIGFSPEENVLKVIADDPVDYIFPKQVLSATGERFELAAAGTYVNNAFAFPPGEQGPQGACAIGIPPEDDVLFADVPNPNQQFYNLFQALAAQYPQLDGIEQLQEAAAGQEEEDDSVVCVASYAPGAYSCTWQGRLIEMNRHLSAEHYPNFLDTDEIILEPTKHKVLHCFSDLFVCYVTFHHRDLICVVEHACPCFKNYAYRCILISENPNLPHLSSNVRLTLNELKDFKQLRQHRRVTRFSNADVEPRKSVERKISVWIRIFHLPSEEAVAGIICLSEAEDLPHSRRNICVAVNEETNLAKLDIALQQRVVVRNEDWGILSTEVLPLSPAEKRERQLAVHCPLNYLPRPQVCNWEDSKELLFVHMKKQHEGDLHHTRTVVLEPTQYKVLHFTNEIFLCYVAYDAKDIVCVVQHAAASNTQYFYRCSLVPVTQDLPHVTSGVLPVPKTVNKYREVRRNMNVYRFKQPEVEVRTYEDGRVCTVIQILPTGNTLHRGVPRRHFQPIAAQEQSGHLMLCALSEARPSIECPWLGPNGDFWNHLLKEHRAIVHYNTSITLQPMQCGILQYANCVFICYCTYDQDGNIVCNVWNAPSNRAWLYRNTLLSGTEVPQLEATVRHTQKWYKAIRMTTSSAYATRFSVYSVEERRSASGIIEINFTIQEAQEPLTRRINWKERNNKMVWCILNGQPGTNPCNWMGSWKSLKDHIVQRHKKECFRDVNTHLEVNKCVVLLGYSDAFVCYTAIEGDELICRIYHACPCGSKYWYRVTLASSENVIKGHETYMRYIHTAGQSYQQILDSPREARFEIDPVMIRRLHPEALIVLIEIFAPESNESSPALF